MVRYKVDTKGMTYKREYSITGLLIDPFWHFGNKSMLIE